MLSRRPTVIERAFEIAHSGDYAGVTQIRKQLVAERYDVAQLQCPVLMRQIRSACRTARADRAASDRPTSSDRQFG
jgi:hypothetical protein